MLFALKQKRPHITRISSNCSRGEGAKIYPKLRINKPNDKYEKEADNMADTVIAEPKKNSAPPSNDEFQKSNTILAKRLPLLQREEDESNKENDESSDLQTYLQRQEEGDSESVNQNQEESTQEPNDASDADLSPVQRQSELAMKEAPASLHEELKRSKGNGEYLPRKTKDFMAESIGANFDKIKVHHGEQADKMNRNIKAKAFTHEKDIYFKTGQFQPSTEAGKHLLAHELIHTLQQGAVPKIEDTTPKSRTIKKTFEEKEQAINIVDQATDPVSVINPPKPSLKNRPAQGPLKPVDNLKTKNNPSFKKSTDEYNEIPAFPKSKGSEAETKLDAQSDKNIKELSPPEKKKQDLDKSKIRLTNMVSPELDGGPERIQKENEVNKGTISKELTALSDNNLKIKQRKISHLSKNERHKENLVTKMEQVENAVEEKPKDKEAEAQTSQIISIDTISTPETKPDTARAELKNQMEAALPKTLEDVDEFKSRAKGVNIGHRVSQMVKKETSKVESTYEQIESIPTPAKPKPNVAIGAIEKPTETKKLNLGQELVPEVDKAKTDLSQFNQESDNLLQKEGISEENLAMVDSGDLAEAKNERIKIKDKSTKGPEEVKSYEKQGLKNIETELRNQEQQDRNIMRRRREKGLSEARQEQKSTKSKLELEREKVTKHINGIYEKANQSVKTKLSNLETKSLAEFDRMQKQASHRFENNVKYRINRFKTKRYSSRFGWIKKGKDWLLGIDDFPEIKNIFNTEKNTFISTLDTAITKIIGESKLVINECQGIIKQARQNIDRYVLSLRPALVKTGQEAQKKIKGKLDQLDTSVKLAEERLKNSLHEKRAKAISDIEKKIEKMKEELSGALSKLGKLLLDAMLKFFKWALEKAGYKPGEIMNIINKGKAVVSKIVTDPKGFFKNLGKGVGQGIGNFMTNIKQHLIKGLINWLTGSLGSAGLVLPQVWNLKGIFSLFLQIMGLSYDFLRSRMVKYVGEPIVAAAEGGFEMLQKIRQEGPIALWNWIKEKANEIKQAVFDGIRNWVIFQVIKKATIKILSMLNPVGAIVQAILTIYDVVMFFVDNWQRIVEMVKTIFGTISDIAFGRIAVVAKKVESIMAMTIPMIISFLARFLGLSGLAKVIKNLIRKVRQPVVRIVDKVAKWIGKKIKNLFAKGKKALKSAKMKAGKIKDKIVDWWKIKTSFKSKDGKTHKLHFKGKGSQAKLMISSITTSFKAFIQSVNAKGSTDKDSAKTEAVRLNGEIWKAVRIKDDKERKRKLKSLFKQLAEQLTKLMKGEPVHSGTKKDPIPIHWTKFGHLKSIRNLKPKKERWEKHGFKPPKTIISAPIGKKTPVEIPPTMKEKFKGERDSKRNNDLKVIDIGVEKSNLPEEKKLLKRGGERADKVKNRFRNTLLPNYNYSMEGYDMDHVQDLGFGGDDAIPNLWPLDKDMNRIIGNRVYKQVVAHKDSSGKVHLDKPKNLKGKWFIIESMDK